MARKGLQNLIPAVARQSLADLGNFISTARKEKKMSQAELAARVGIGRMSISRMEQGAAEVAIGYYISAAWVLGLSFFVWDDFAKTRSDTTTADILERLRRQLPSRIRKKKENLENDF